MRTIDDYLDAARGRAGLRSDREVGRELGLKGSIVSQWRTRRVWPADETMVRLAVLAGVDPQEALLELSYWRTDGTARSYYLELLRRLTARAAAAAAIALLLAGSLVGSNPAGASASNTLEFQANGLAKLYIMRQMD